MRVEHGEPDAADRFVERFALDLAAAGMPRMAARVFAGLLIACLLYTSDAADE